MLVWVIVLVYVGSFSLFCASLVLMKKYQGNDVSSERILNSRIPWITRKSLFGYRITYFLFTVGVLIYDFYLNGETLLCFFTVWNYISQIIYFGLIVFYTQFYSNEKVLGKSLRVLIFNLNQLTICMVILVSTLTWSLLLPAALSNGDDKKLLNFTSYCEHAVNVFGVGLEFFMNGMTIELHGFTVIVAWATLYTLFCTTFQVAGGFSPYFFTDISDPFTPLWSILVTTLVSFFYFLVYRLSILKEKYFPFIISLGSLEEPLTKE
eukprot:c19292_g1_i1.p1 GENE.c19292_g1_i1~~c19292_g1_i1.p1  ORF type:complete len:278 (+),score=58.05 c19292_g1_i1:42-836(+)